jgi:hypothetical protein
MKLKLFRKSGGLIDAESSELYTKEWREWFDKIEKRVDEINADKDNKLYLLPKHVLMQRFCNYIERLLYKKYNKDVEVEMPKTAKQWTSLIEQYKGTPIMIAQRADTKGLVMVLMDDLQG